MNTRLPPRNIVLIKSHSAGIGDILRSSAAWRSLKKRWPEARLHLVFLSKHAGYPSEELISQHHLLASAHFICIREQDPSVKGARKVPFSQISKQFVNVCHQVQADLIIDFEPYGFRSTLLSWLGRRALGCPSVGVGQVPLRGLFYSHSSGSMEQYAESHGLSLPMDYTLRDYVALGALGIERGNTQIELQVPDSAKPLTREIRAAAAGLPVIGINIGCGTPDAVHKRPGMAHFAQCIAASLESAGPCRIVLTGAPNEKQVNDEFWQALTALKPGLMPALDYAGKTRITGLTGVIDACDLFISTDSGPYHMAVGLGKSTLAWFTYDEVTSFHDTVGNCIRLTQPEVAQFATAFRQLWAPQHEAG
jgi:ADP-heptose:LPS heptosyltransferase